MNLEEHGNEIGWTRQWYDVTSPKNESSQCLCGADSHTHKQTKKLVHNDW